MFDKLREITVKAYVFVEGHQFYLDNWFHQAMYHAMRRLSTTIEGSGLIDDANDIFYLNRQEIAGLVYEVMVNYAMGFPVSNGNRWRTKIEKRKRIMKALSAWEPPPALGPAPERVTEPFTRMLWGLTTETINKWRESMDFTDNGETRVLRGVAGSPGTIVGKARVIKDVRQISELEEGEILVAPSTEPSWSYAFVKIAGTVTDIGGVMSHAAIVCREYGLPAVTGVGVGTRVIKTGQMIEVRGDEGVVKLLK
jgi:pyruvate,water dikinase